MEMIHIKFLFQSGAVDVDHKSIQLLPAGGLGSGLYLLVGVLIDCAAQIFNSMRKCQEVGSQGM